MKKILLIAFLVALSKIGQAQTTGPGFIIYVGSAPSGTCSAGAYLEQVIGLGTVYTCQSGTWTQISGGGGGAGTVTSIATTSPITGGTITATGTIACATCVKATSPGAGIAHFAGSTQEVTSSLIVAADITSGTITGTQIASSVALAGSPTTTTQSASDNSTKIATTAYVDRVAPAMVQIETHTASTSATLDFTTCFTSTYHNYELEFNNLVPATNAANLQLLYSTNGGSTWDSTSGHYAWSVLLFNSGGTASDGSGSTTNIAFSTATSPPSNTANLGGVSGNYRVHDPLGAHYVQLSGTTNYVGSGTNASTGLISSGTYSVTTGAVNAFRVLFSSGNITSGTVTCYGVTP